MSLDTQYFMLKPRLSRNTTVQFTLFKNRLQKFFGEEKPKMSIRGSDYMVCFRLETLSWLLFNSKVSTNRKF